MRDDIEGLSGAPHGRERHSFATLISAWTGTAVALALISALGWWAWGLGTRDAAAVPIVAAAGGAVKLRPEGGGTTVPNSDIESYGLATEAALRLDAPGLAPETAAPTDEDLSLGALATLSALPPEREDPVEAEVPVGAVDADAVDLTKPTPPPARPELGTDLASLDSSAITEATGPTPPAGEGSALAPAQTPIAPARPHDLPARMASARREAVAEEDSLARRAARSAYQLQLGAYLSEDLTRAEWARISRAHAELLNNRALAVQTTLSGGQTYYRLRVGPFDGLAEAASVCEALRARGQDCIPAGNQ
ncbi:MAG: SPOR domain-containing protein [Pseudomonadota bacterium]